MNRRIDIGEVPLVGGQSSVGLHVPLAGHDVELLLGVGGVDHGERDAVEGLREDLRSAQHRQVSASRRTESQMAKKGYSHLSGIDRTSSICMCFQSYAQRSVSEDARERAPQRDAPCS